MVRSNEVEFLICRLVPKETETYIYAQAASLDKRHPPGTVMTKLHDGLLANPRPGFVLSIALSFAKTKNAFEMIGMRSACNIVTRTKFQGVAEFWRTTTPKNRAGAWTPARALPAISCWSPP